MASYGLMIGINQYGIIPGTSPAPLSGCVNDMRNNANHLVNNFNLDGWDLHLLIDRRATAKAIYEKFAQAASVCQPGDRFFFAFSGHGTDITDGIGKIRRSLCPIDFDWSPEKMLTNVQIVELLNKFKDGVIINMIIDSCFSGNMLRKLAPAGRLVVSKHLPPPDDIELRNEFITKKNGPPLMADRSFLNPDLDVVCLEACGPKQTSADVTFNGRSYGAFTNMFYEIMDSKPANTPVGELMKITQKTLEEQGYEQDPQAEGTRLDRPFLS